MWHIVLAQLPDAGIDEALRMASTRGWEAVMLVVIMCLGFAGFSFILKYVMVNAQAREERLAARVTHLEEVIRNELFAALRSNSEVLGKVLIAADAIVRAADRMTGTLERFTSILDVRPCLLPATEQRKLLKEFADEESKKHGTH